MCILSWMLAGFALIRFYMGVINSNGWEFLLGGFALALMIVLETLTEEE